MRPTAVDVDVRKDAKDFSMLFASFTVAAPAAACGVFVCVACPGLS